ncbi:UNVERIFIED_CONTAM: hypothetical protein Sangu_3078800 [Sesamum angustifolium]|uniref:Uncharacterized protein n=1 Tax=Sesamum angustifolium TaxID=2727405 RepID=A0AAW2K8R7_9LAMI
MNGAVEAEKKKIKNKNILLEIAITYRDWHEMLPFALHAYRTSVRTSTGATPYSIVYGMEAVLPLEMKYLSKSPHGDGVRRSQWAKSRYEQL